LASSQKNDDGGDGGGTEPAVLSSGELNRCLFLFSYVFVPTGHVVNPTSRQRIRERVTGAVKDAGERAITAIVKGSMPAVGDDDDDGNDAIAKAVLIRVATRVSARAWTPPTRALSVLASMGEAGRKKTTISQRAMLGLFCRWPPFLALTANNGLSYEQHACMPSGTLTHAMVVPGC
jgi:hypothetical protein